MNPEHRQALDERRTLIEHRATELAERAINERAPWIQAIGQRAEGTETSNAWREEIRVIAAYRDSYDITGPRPLGTIPESVSQRADRDRAAIALRRAQKLVDSAAEHRPAQVRAGSIAH